VSLYIELDKSGKNPVGRSRRKWVGVAFWRQVRKAPSRFQRREVAILSGAEWGILPPALKEIRWTRVRKIF